jgi:shikimate kinase
MNSANLILTGFMGTGKTTAGNIIAEKMNRPFFDMDLAITHRTGFTIPRIFAQKSEPFFRAMERGLVHELALQSGLVIATGGGALVHDDNLQVIMQSGVVICLLADEATLEARLQGSDARPLAADWRTHWQKRYEQYQRMPHHVDTTGKTPQEVAEEVIALWHTVSK